MRLRHWVTNSEGYVFTLSEYLSLISLMSNSNYNYDNFNKYYNDLIIKNNALTISHKGEVLLSIPLKKENNYYISMDALKLYRK